jgi:hypothetical protein
MVMAMDILKQQRVDELREHLAVLFARRDALAADPAQANTARRLDGEIGEHCAAIADLERSLKATP